MIIIRLIKLPFLEDVALWLLRSLLLPPRSRRNSCTAYFAMVCGKEEQNVRRREEELKGKGNVRTKRILLQWCAEPRLCYCMWKLDLPISLPASGTLCRDFPGSWPYKGAETVTQTIIRAKSRAPWNQYFHMTTLKEQKLFILIFLWVTLQSRALGNKVKEIQEGKSRLH